ncbi:MAG: RNA polymerase sigma factor [Acidobacteria bacterium]|nr:RNA polymerase sigma factor [Acidobacteriota bacterium]
MSTHALELNPFESLIPQEITEISQESFENLYTRHYRRVYSLCLRMTANVSDAEDLAHDVFLQVQRKLASFRGDSAFTTWLHRITVNQVLMHFRKKSVRSELTTEDGEMPEKSEPFTIRTQSTPMVDHLALAAAIEKLPPGYRKIFLLHDVDGYEHEEIAKLLGISAGTSKSQLHKARMKLRTLLSKRNEPETTEELVEEF